MLIIGWLAAGLCSAAAAENPNGAIRDALKRWTEAFNAGDAGPICDLFAPDLIATYEGQPERGRDALCALLSRSLNDPDRSYRYRLQLREILVSGKLAVVRLVWTLTVTRRDNGASETIEEPGIDVFRRQPDGSWKISRYLAFPAAH